MKRLPKSVRIFVRREKARIRRENFDVGAQEEKIRELLQKMHSPKKEKQKEIKSPKTSKPAKPKKKKVRKEPKKILNRKS